MHNKLLNNTVEKEVNHTAIKQLFKYAILFTVLYKLSSFLVASIDYIIGIDLRGSSSLIISIIFSSMVTSFQFSKNNNMILTKRDRGILTLMSIIGIWISDIIFKFIQEVNTSNTMSSSILEFHYNIENIAFFIFMNIMMYIGIFIFSGFLNKDILEDITKSDNIKKPHLSLKTKIIIFIKKVTFGFLWTAICIVLIACILYFFNFDSSFAKEYSGRFFLGSLLIGFSGSFFCILPGTRKYKK